MLSKIQYKTLKSSALIVENIIVIDLDIKRKFIDNTAHRLNVQEVFECFYAKRLYKSVALNFYLIYWWGCIVHKLTHNSIYDTFFFARDNRI